MADVLQNETEVLFPDRAVTVRGEAVEVRELTFLQGLEAAPLIQPLIADLYDLFRDGALEPDLAALSAVLGGHREATVRLISLATGRPAEWVEGLSDSEGQAVLMAFWLANTGFFVSRLVQHRAFLAAADKLYRPSPLASDGSSPS